MLVLLNKSNLVNEKSDWIDIYIIYTQSEVMLIVYLGKSTRLRMRRNWGLTWAHLLGIKPGTNYSAYESLNFFIMEIW